MSSESTLQKVVVRTRHGRVRRGFADPRQIEGSLRLINTQGDEERFELEDLKAVFVVKEFEGDPKYKPVHSLSKLKGRCGGVGPSQVLRRGRNGRTYPKQSELTDGGRFFSLAVGWRFQQPLCLYRQDGGRGIRHLVGRLKVSLNRLLAFLIGNPREFPLEIRLFNAMSLLNGVTNLAGAPVYLFSEPGSTACTWS